MAEFNKKYGPPGRILVCIGDHAQKHKKHLKLQAPAPLKRVIKRFEQAGHRVRLVNECYTSASCCKCRLRPLPKPKKKKNNNVSNNNTNTNTNTITNTDANTGTKTARRATEDLQQSGAKRQRTSASPPTPPPPRQARMEKFLWGPSPRPGVCRLALKTGVMQCGACGHVFNRDTNASVNMVLASIAELVDRRPHHLPDQQLVDG
jgi:hypothetical protein